MKLTVWTDAEVQDATDQFNAGETFTDEQLTDISYQYFKRQDQDDLAILKTLYDQQMSRLIFPLGKKLTFEAYSKRYQEILAVS